VSRRDRPFEERDGGRRQRSLHGFLRSLLDGIPWSESAEREDVLEFAAPEGGRLLVHNANGRTCVRGEERADIAVRIRKHARAESTEAAESLLEHVRLEDRYGAGGELELEVEIPTRWNRHGSAHLEIAVPRDLQVTVSAANGKISLSGLRGTVKARSSNGSVRICDVVGDVEAFTSNAPVSCDCTCGRLVCRSSNGKIKLEDHRGSVDASTSNGLIHATLDELGKAGCVLATSNGRIVLELPDDVDADVDLRVDNGVIRTDVPIDDEVDGRETNGRVRGRLGRGGAVIRLRTSNGAICLR